MDVNALAELIGAGWGILTSLGFKLIPQLDEWLYNSVPNNKRGLVMLGLSLVVPVAIILVSCIGLYNLVPCTVDIWKDAVKAWIAFVVSNQGLFLMTGDSNAKKRLQQIT